jgi:signal transduction histidine kinase
MLKHELRTPVNYIMGYSELLLEAADKAGEAELTKVVTTIYANGRVLCELLDKKLSKSSDGIDISQCNALGNTLHPAIRQIVKAASLASRIQISEAFAADLGRIRQAVYRLTTIPELGMTQLTPQETSDFL